MQEGCWGWEERGGLLELAGSESWGRPVGVGRREEGCWSRKRGGVAAAQQAASYGGRAYAARERAVKGSQGKGLLEGGREEGHMYLQAGAVAEIQADDAPICIHISIPPPCPQPPNRLLIDGFLSLGRGNPNMNSLVAVGSSTSFAVGAASALSPSLGGVFDAGFLEEPVMLLAFVLLGRALEARAKVRGRGIQGEGQSESQGWSRGGQCERQQG